MEVVYLIGPYRHIDDWERLRNIDAAAMTARKLWKMGYACICPHNNTRFFSGSDIPESLFLDGNINILKRCNAVIVMDGYKTSSGSQKEIQAAKENNITIYRFEYTREGIELIEGLEDE